jgi:hypothetical protein
MPTKAFRSVSQSHTLLTASADPPPRRGEYKVLYMPGAVNLIGARPGLALVVIVADGLSALGDADDARGRHIEARWIGLLLECHATQEGCAENDDESSSPHDLELLSLAPANSSSQVPDHAVLLVQNHGLMLVPTRLQTKSAW